jgi:endonuclease/exonuclease/phosphatase family metal-dependent hydrolase
MSAELDDGSMLLKRSEWVRRQLQGRLAECSTRKEYTLLVASYNVHDQFPPATALDFDNWLLRNVPGAPDLVVVGLQEVDLSNESMYGSTNPSMIYTETKEFKWLFTIHQCINKRAPYEMLGMKRLVGMFVMLFATQDLRPFIRSLSAASVSCGVLGIVGNKGAVALRLRVFNHALVFVNAHLAAHAGEYGRRCQDYHTIRDYLKFPAIQEPEFDRSPEMMAFGENYRAELVNESDSDLIVWMGDLNFRIDMDHQEARVMAKGGRYEPLLQGDQLSRAIRNGEAFPGYQEVPLMFPPTYKYDVDSVDTFDTSDKQRCPAWTDRILWRSHTPHLIVSPVAYWTDMELMLSDHKPVAALFRVRSQYIDHGELERVYGDVLKQWDSKLNALIPQTKLDCSVLDFGELCFNSQLERSVRLSLRSEGTASFEVFVQNAAKGERGILRWLNVQPSNGVLHDGSVSIRICMRIDGSAAHDFNYERINLRDLFIVVHVVGGRDHFVALEGSWRPSVFGRRLDPNETVPPLVLQSLVDTLSVALPDEQAFFDDGKPALMASIIEQLDGGGTKLSFDLSFSLTDVYRTLCQLLLMWLESVPDGRLIPGKYDKLITQAAYERRLDFVVDALDPGRQACFRCVIGFLRRHCQAVNLLTSSRQLSYVCKIFALVIFEELGPNGTSDNNGGGESTQQLVKSRAKFIKQFLIGS